LLKRIFGMFFVLLLLLQTVCMASARIEGFRYNTLFSSAQAQFLHIEISLNQKVSKYDVHIDPDNKKQLIVTIPNTKLKNNDLEMRNLDGKIANKIALSEDQHNIKAVISLPYNASYAEYKTYMVDKDKRHRKTPVLAIDIAKEPAINNTTSSLRSLRGHTIVIDPGHGGSDSGAVGPDGIMEKTVTLAIAKKVDKILSDNGAKVVMTRTTDRDVYAPNDTAVEELQARVDVGENAGNADIFMSIHANSFINDTAHGTETFYYNGSDNGKNLASFVQDELVKATNLADRGISTANFYVIKHSSMPAILIETAFISNNTEEQLLNDETFQTTIAQAICRGIAKYFQNN